MKQNLCDLRFNDYLKVLQRIWPLVRVFISALVVQQRSGHLPQIGCIEHSLCLWHELPSLDFDIPQHLRQGVLVRWYHLQVLIVARYFPDKLWLNETIWLKSITKHDQSNPFIR